MDKFSIIQTIIYIWLYINVCYSFSKRSDTKLVSVTSLYVSKPGGGGGFKSILGENIVNCREFKLDSAKTYDFLGSFLNRQAMPFCGIPEIAFLGRSNVGKSSLLNCISNSQKKLAVTSKTAGRTQSVNLFKCSDEDGGICIFADLPGYGFAKIPKEKQKEISANVEKYLLERDGLKRVMILIDARREPLEADFEMIQFLKHYEIRHQFIATKVDLLNKSELENSLKRLREVHRIDVNESIIPFSAVAEIGKKEVWRSIKDGILARE